MPPALRNARTASVEEGRRLTLDEALAVGLDDRPESPMRAGPAPGPDTARVGDHSARGARPNESPDRSPAVYLGPDRRGSRGSHPHQAGLQDPHPTGVVGPRGRIVAPKYVVAR